MSDGQGYVERLPSGRYRARLPRALGRRKGETFDSEAQAQGWLAAMLEALRAPAPEPARPPPGCNVLRSCICACGAKQGQRSEDCT